MARPNNGNKQPIASPGAIRHPPSRPGPCHHLVTTPRHPITPVCCHMGSSRSPSTSTSPHSLGTAVSSEARSMDKAKRYDRGIRVWGAHGQEALEAARVCLLNAGPTGTEALKNLVLGGIHSFTIADGAKVEPHDLGNNFLLAPDALGASRAQCATGAWVDGREAWPWVSARVWGSVGIDEACAAGKPGVLLGIAVRLPAPEAARPPPALPLPSLASCAHLTRTTPPLPHCQRA